MTIMAGACDCSARPLLNCLLLFKIIFMDRINKKRRIEVVIPYVWQATRRSISQSISIKAQHILQRDTKKGRKLRRMRGISRQHEK